MHIVMEKNVNKAYYEYMNVSKQSAKWKYKNLFRFCYNSIVCVCAVNRWIKCTIINNSVFPV